jgi:hypothetical protein
MTLSRGARHISDGRRGLERLSLRLISRAPESGRSSVIFDTVGCTTWKTKTAWNSRLRNRQDHLGSPPGFHRTDHAALYEGYVATKGALRAWLRYCVDVNIK